MIFQSVKGVCSQEVGGNSFFNTDEVTAVIEWIQKLLRGSLVRPADIGVVTPYRKQCSMIIEELENNDLNNILVGSAETFQGQERKAIILSTVKTDSELGDFITNKQVK